MKIRALQILLLTLFCLPMAEATHIVGGTLSYECLGFNNVTQEMTLRIRLYVYRDAINGQAPFDDPAAVGIFAGNNPSVPFTTVSLFSPQITDIPIDLGNPCLIVPPNIGVEEGFYTATVTLPYNPDGYHLSYQRCCRNNTINNLVMPEDQGATYTIFLSGQAQQMCNSSPTFNNFPPPVICRYEPLNFDHSATDIDGHTLVYELCNPLHGANDVNPMPNPPAGPSYQNVPFSAGFSAGYPMPAIQPGMTIDPNTGLLTGTPLQTGQYVVGVCVSEYDANGNLLSYTLRDFQFNVAICDNQVQALVQADSVDITNNHFYFETCADQTFNFVNLSADPNLITDYEWHFDIPGSNPITSTAINPTITFPGPGVYEGYLVANPGQNICTDSAFLHINIIPPIIADFEVDMDTCNPAFPPVQFNNMTTGGAGINTWSWSFGDGNTSNAESPSHAYLQPGTYTVSLVVQDQEGCSGITSQQVTWFPPTNMDVTYNYTGCLGDDITFINNSTPLTAAYTHAWTFGDGNISNIAAPTHTYTQAGTYNVQLETTSPFGCVSTYTETINVGELPVVDFTYVYDSCVYDSVSFFDQSTGVNGLPIVQWQWDFQDGTISNLQDPNHLYLLAGTYPIELTVTDQNGCSNSMTDDIDWYPKPVIDVNIASDTGCAVYEVFFDNQSYPINGYTTIWNFGDGTGSTAASPTHTYPTPGIYPVDLLITSPLGCFDTFEDTIVVLERPTADFDFTFDLCAIDSVEFDEFSTTNTNGTPLVDWAWDFDDGNTASAQDINHLYGLAGDFNVSLIVTDVDGCTDTSTQLVQWHPAPIVAVDVSDSIGCQPLAITFDNQSYPINGYQLTWDFGDGGSDTAASPTHTYVDYGIFNVHLHILSPTGCTGDFYDTIEVWENPTAAFSYDYDSCVVAEVLLSDESTTNTAGDSLVSWTWDFGDGSAPFIINESLDTVYAYTPRNDYPIQLVVEDVNGCTDTLDFTLEYYPAPVFPVPSHSDEDCAPLSVIFDNNIDNDFPGYTFDWDFGDGNVSNAFDTTYIYPDRGTYYSQITVTSAAGCIETFYDTIVVNGNPIARFNATYDECDWGEVEFLNTSYWSPDGTIDQWNWDFGDGIGIGDYHKEYYQYADTGTYNVTLVIEDTNGCTDDTTMQVTWNPQPVFPLVLDYSEDCVPLDAPIDPNTPYPLAGYSLNWDFGNGATSTTNTNGAYTYSQPGTYTRSVTITSPTGCVETFSSQHVALEVPTANFTYNPAIVSSLSPQVNFVDQSSLASGWYWTFDENNEDSYEQNPTYTYQDTGQMNVQLIATHINGCTDTTNQIVDVVPMITYYLPNAFTPNGDAKNDVYRGNGIFDYIHQFDMQIYNRWGELVFQTNSPFDSWNGHKNNTGELCQAGVYVVTVRLTGGRGEQQEIKGFATIVL